VRRTGFAIALVATLWVLTRVLNLVALHLLPWVPFDVVLYADWAQGLRDGSFPVADPRWQYPDLMAVILVLPTHLGVGYLTAFVALALLIDLAIMVALVIVWRRTGGWIGGLLVWALAGVWIGPVLLVRLDLFATLFAVLALVVTGRPWLSAIFSGLGTGLKVWPIVTMLAIPRRRLLPAVGAFVAALVGSALLVRLWIPAGDWFLAAQASRGLHAESVGVLPYLVRGLLGWPPTFSETNGTLELVSPWAGRIGLALTLVGLLIIAILAVLRWTDRLDHVLPADLVAVSVLVLVATGRVFSPQFYVWLGGVAAVALLDRRSVLRLPMLLVIVSAVVGQYVYPLRTGWDVQEPDAMLAQIVRLLLVLSALGLALWRMRRVPVCATS
jgi:hypothetical protein